MLARCPSRIADEKAAATGQWSVRVGSVPAQSPRAESIAGAFESYYAIFPSPAVRYTDGDAVDGPWATEAGRRAK